MASVSDIPNALAAGYSNWGQTAGQNIVRNRALRQEQDERAALLGRQQKAANALPGILAGDMSGLADIGHADLGAAATLGAGIQKQNREQDLLDEDKFNNESLAAIAHVMQAPVEQRQALWSQQHEPRLAKSFPKKWDGSPDPWDDQAMLGLAQKLALGNKERMKFAQAYGIIPAMAGDDGLPSTVQSYQFYKGLKTPEEQADFMNIVRAPKVLDMGGYYAGVDPRNPMTSTPTPLGYKTPSPDANPDLKRAQAEATEIGKGEGERVLNAPKAQAAFNAGKAKLGNVRATIAETLPRVNYATAGFASLANAIPGTPGYDLREKLATIEANLAFGELQQMRDNSPTGGALGAVAVRELDLLGSTMQSIKQAQSPQQLADNLRKLDTLLAGSGARMDAAYAAQYPGAGGTPPPPATKRPLSAFER